MSWFFVYIFALVWLNNLETLIYKYKEFRGSTKIACLISKSWKTHNPRIFPNAQFTKTNLNSINLSQYYHPHSIPNFFQAKIIDCTLRESRIFKPQLAFTINLSRRQHSFLGLCFNKKSTPRLDLRKKNRITSNLRSTMLSIFLPESTLIHHHTHPTENFMSMTLIKIPSVLTWAYLFHPWCPIHNFSD